MFRIVSATGEQLQPALEQLFSEWPSAARTRRIEEVRQELVDGDFDPRHLLLAKLDGQPVGAQLTIVRSDGVGMVWPPVVNLTSHDQAVRLTRDEIEDKLLNEARRRLDGERAWIGQALLEPSSSRDQATLQRNGFTRLTELQFFERPVANPVRSPPTNRPTLSYEPFRRARNRLAFVNMLEETYRGSLDCHELNDVRDGQQSLRTHEAAGAFRPDMWRLYRRAEADVGVLLMVERPDQKAWEVLYLGVAEPARGCGIGRAMLLDALSAAVEANVEKLLIVVDARNVPAMSLYESLGFRLAMTRVAFVRFAPQSPRNRPQKSAGQQ